MKLNKIKRTLHFSTLLVAMGVLLVAGAAKAGFGISPPSFGEQNLVRGMTYERSVIITLDDPKTDLRANAEINVPGADGWISVGSGNTFTLKKGEKAVPLVLRLKIPEDAAFKNYKGSIIIRTFADKSAMGAVGVTLGGQIDVDFSVVDQKINSFIIKDVKVSGIFKGENAEVILTLSNIGNIPTTPTRISLDIYGDDKKTLIASKENIGKLESIKPFSSGHIKALFDTKDLAIGSYWGKLRVYNGSEMVYEGEVHLSISAAESKSAEKAKASLVDQLMNNQMVVYGVVVVLLLIVLLIVVKNIRRGKKSKRARK